MNTRTSTLIFSALVIVATGLRAADAPPAENPAGFKNEHEKVSYAVGVNIAKQIKAQEVPVNREQVVRGIRDSLLDQPLQMTEEEAQKAVTQYIGESSEKRAVYLAGMRKNETEGAAFLANNKNQPGVITTPEGLQYKILHDGVGLSPKREDIVMLNYRGTLLDGTEIEDSRRFNKPVPVAVNGSIEGWTLALMMMKPGSKWQLFIPAALAYRDYGRPPKVGPEATLIYEIELVSIQKPSVVVPSPQRLTSDTIKVPSFEDMQKGAQIEMIKAEDVERMEKESQQQSKTNPPAKKTP